MTRAVYRGPWRVDLTVRDGVTAPIAGNALARAVADALDAGGAPSPASIGLILSDDAELAALNEAHLGVTGATDVLSFPLLPPEAFPVHPGAAGHAAGAAVRFALPPSRRQHLGDIVVSVERAIDQAEAGRGGQTGDVRWSPADELSWSMRLAREKPTRPKRPRCAASRRSYWAPPRPRGRPASRRPVGWAGAALLPSAQALPAWDRALSCCPRRNG